MTINKTVLENKEIMPDLKVDNGIVYKRTMFDRGFEYEQESAWKLFF